MMTLTDKVALITGGGSGMGEGTAHVFAEAGAKVAVLDISAERAETVAGAIRSAGGDALALAADVSQPQQIEAAIEHLIDHYGRLDVLFANAGINGVWAPIDDITVEEWRRTIDINLNGTFYTIHYAVPYMKRQGGAIIITSSVNGTRVFGTAGATAYSCTKGAQVVMAKMLALELAQDRIRVNVICPGSIETNINTTTQKRNTERITIPKQIPDDRRIPITDGKRGTPEDVGQLVLFLASDAAKHITGTEMWIDGAQTLL